MKLCSIILLLSVHTYCISQSLPADKLIHAGNNLYQQQQYDLAASEYQKAIQMDPANMTAKFNLANALYKQGKQSAAEKLFSEISLSANEEELKAKTYYNKGVVLTRQKKLEESIESYKSALRNNPRDIEARENLQKALLELKKKNPPKKKENDPQKKKQEQQKKQPQPKMNQKEAEQRLKLLEQKEKEVQQRIQKEKAKTGGGQVKDW